MITFKKVRIKNFLSIGNAFIEFNLDSKGKTIIIGKNGSGKSTLIDAISFALYGKPIRNINKPQLVNSINEKDCVVECEFNIGSTEYKIVRGMAPAIFEIYQNGKLIDQDSKVKDYQSFLETNILKLNYKSFTQIVVLGSSNYKPFMTLTPAERRSVIEDLLDIQVFSKMNDILKDWIKTSKQELEDCKTEIKIIEEKIKLQSDSIQKLKQKDSNYLQSRISEVENIELNIQKLSTKKQDLYDSIQNLKETVLKKKEKFEDALDQYTLIQSSLSKKLMTNDKKIQFYNDNSSCPTCKQDITADIKEEKIQEMISNNATLEKELNNLIEEMDKVKTKLKKYSQYETKYDEHSKEYVDVQNEIDSLEKYKITVKKEIESSENQEDKELQDSKSKLKVFEDDLNSKKEAMKDIQTEKEYYAVCEELLKDRGIKSKIIKEYLPVMNQLINKYLNDLDLFVNFTIDENFKETVKSRHRDEFSYESFSEGQKFRINIAILLTWREIAKMKNSANTNILIMDEVFDSSLDTEGIDSFMKLLDVVSQDSNVYVISHRGESMLDKFDKTLEVYMKKGFTQIKDS